MLQADVKMRITSEYLECFLQQRAYTMSIRLPSDFSISKQHQVLIGMFSKQLLLSFHRGWVRFEAFKRSHCLESLHSAGVHYLNRGGGGSTYNKSQGLWQFFILKLINNRFI